jgi:hypothetical protein
MSTAVKIMAKWQRLLYPPERIRSELARSTRNPNEEEMSCAEPSHHQLKELLVMMQFVKESRTISIQQSSTFALLVII